MAGLVNLDLLLVVDNVLLVVIALALYGQAMFPCRPVPKRRSPGRSLPDQTGATGDRTPRDGSG